jgi:hypothetical protein
MRCARCSARCGARGGVVVAGVGPEAGGASDPLMPGDVIYSLNQQSVTGLESLRSALSTLSATDAIVLHVERQGQLRFVASRRRARVEEAGMRRPPHIGLRAQGFWYALRLRIWRYVSCRPALSMER